MSRQSVLPRSIFPILVAIAVAVAACGSADEPEAAFAVNDERAVMSGVIGSSTPDAVRALVADNPDVTTIVMTDVPGSIDDAANLEAARLIREAGLSTHVPADAMIASGGVDFYLAGAARSYEQGAQFGVHSWAAGDGTTGADVPRDDSSHRLYLDYYAEMGVSSDFYWFTLEAAPAESIHYMTPDELERYQFGAITGPDIPEDTEEAFTVTALPDAEAEPTGRSTLGVDVGAW